MSDTAAFPEVCMYEPTAINALRVALLIACRKINQRQKVGCVHRALTCTRPVYTVDLPWNRVSNPQPSDHKAEIPLQGPQLPQCGQVKIDATGASRR
ncbi:hypothetical protein AVEN_229371-1 [Araneus ventricosus]|uniref:Uncharacterized protein n=1 Tax=Araneus ventricosus TaxID=182803 RepID=A0A4Y2I3W5_ARAVE|nr:hypothetical protein AVEN_229371-1 [Araneus ventricosus]